MKVFWTDTAVRHLSGIHAYIAQNSPQYARRIVLPQLFGRISIPQAVQLG